MKYKRILPVFLFFSMFLTSCGNFSNIKKNQLIIEKIDKNTTSTSNIVNGKRILTEEEAKLKALEVLEKYFNVKLYLTEVGSDVQFISSSMVKKDVGLINPSSYPKIQLEYSKSVLENGFYQIYFYTRIEKQSQNTDRTGYFMKIDSKTGECIYLDCYYESKGIPPLNASIDIEEAKEISEEFILKNNIGNIKNIKSVNQNQRRVKDQVSYSLVFEDSDVAGKKVMISIDGNTKKINNLSIGVMEKIKF